MIPLIRSEILKLTSVRAPWWTAAAQVPLFAMAASGAVVSGALTAEDLATEAGLRLLLSHGGVGAILSLCVGVLLGAGEFRHGTVLDTFLSEPRRERVVAAKLAVAGIAGVVIGVVMAVATVGVGLAWCTAKDVTMDWSVASRSALGIVAWQALFTVLGVALGAMLRSQAVAVTTAVVWFFIAETALAQLMSTVARWLPANAASALGYASSDGLLSQTGGGLVLLGWTLAAALGAVVLTRRRDLA